MIIIQLKGGLGNQLFQYAFGRSLSYKLNTELFLDLSYFNHAEKRKHVIFGLLPFNIKGIIGFYPYTDETGVGISYTDPKPLNKCVEGSKFPYDIQKYSTSFIMDDMELPVYFQGYFLNQIENKSSSFITENFFKDNIDLIHQDLIYSSPISSKYNEILEDMINFDSICLHVRHGDYENLPGFGLCSVEYYQNAISMLCKNLKNPKFFIFTEDFEWVCENLTINYPHEIIRFVEDKNASARAYGELLKVMSQCKHFIIANSTYSWWAAFLSEYPSKIIISPKPWFQDRSILCTDTIDNVKTVNIANNYKEYFKNSSKLLYFMIKENIFLENVEIISNDDSLKISSDENDGKLYLKNILQKQDNHKVIIKISLDSNCFNGLKIYYMTQDKKEYCDENSFTMYYYKNESFTHYILLPENVFLNKIMLKPYILEKKDGDYIIINSFEIKEI